MRASILAIMIFSVGLHAQSAEKKPTLAETKAWLEQEAVPMLRAYGSRLGAFNVLTSEDHQVTRLQLDACRLAIADSSVHKVNDDVQVYRDTLLVPLKDLDVGSIEVKQFQIMTDKPMTIITMHTRASIGKTIMAKPSGKSDQVASMYVGDPQDGERIVTALKRAAILCGAPASPF
jgi:hypothetical protein